MFKSAVVGRSPRNEGSGTKAVAGTVTPSPRATMRNCEGTKPESSAPPVIETRPPPSAPVKVSMLA